MLNVQSLFFAYYIYLLLFLYTVLVVFTLSAVLLNFIFSLRKLSILKRASLLAVHVAKSIYYLTCPQIYCKGFVVKDDCSSHT